MPALPWRRQGFRLLPLAKLQRALLPGRHAPANLPGPQRRLPGMRRARQPAGLTPPCSLAAFKGTRASSPSATAIRYLAVFHDWSIFVTEAHAMKAVPP